MRQYTNMPVKPGIVWQRGQARTIDGLLPPPGPPQIQPRIGKVFQRHSSPSAGMVPHEKQRMPQSFALKISLALITGAGLIGLCYFVAYGLLVVLLYATVVLLLRLKSSITLAVALLAFIVLPVVVLIEPAGALAQNLAIYAFLLLVIALANMARKLWQARSIDDNTTTTIKTSEAGER